MHAHFTHIKNHVVIFIVTGVDFPNRSPPETLSLSQKSIIRYSFPGCHSGARFSRGGNVDFCLFCALLNLLISLFPQIITQVRAGTATTADIKNGLSIMLNGQPFKVVGTFVSLFFVESTLVKLFAGKKPEEASLSTRETLSDCL